MNHQKNGVQVKKAYTGDEKAFTISKPKEAEDAKYLNIGGEVLRVVSLSGKLPEYATSGAAGADLRAFLKEPLIIEAGKRCLVPTGLFIELPEGMEAQIRARSGLAIKHGVGLVNGVGTVDPDYRGEWNVPMINWGEEDFVVNDGDRIAQVVFHRFERVGFEPADEIDDTERGTGGFGHTGVR